jgi:hypothetical protein
VSTDAAATPGAAPAPANPDQPNWASFSRVAGIAAVVGLALYLVAGFGNLAAASGHEAEAAAKTRFSLAYLTGYIFWFSLPLGGMALLMIGYLTKTSWGLLLRRPMEAAIRTLPLMVLLFLPIVIATATGSASPYWWTHPEDTPAPPPTDTSAAPEGSADKREQTIKTGEYMIRKAVAHERKERDEGIYGFLSVPAFIGVGIVLFAIWGTLIYFLDKWGKEASDETDNAKVDAALEKLKNLSGPGIIIFAITITAAATQWVMSLEPGWSSTMFPVIFAVNQFLTCFAFCVAMFLLLVSRPPFRDVMRPKFQLDMGTLMLAFTLFWSYTSFSQFMLVWIGNLPEEIPFFLKRSVPRGGLWYCVSAALIALHFALPFLLLLFRDIKLHPVRLRAVAVYLLVICAVDVTWWIEPSAPHHGSFPFWLMDVGAILGIGGVWATVWLWQLKQRPLLPASQTFLLPEGHHHEHH